MSAGLPILRDIQTAVVSNAVVNPGALIRHVADLFIARSGDHSDEDIALFDDVLSQLVAEIETSARAFLALRLAPLRQAPPRIIRTLAFDPDTDVAGPVLRQSERLDDPILAENAGTMSQDHLLAISRRKSLSPMVTDVLVERGEAQVLLSTAQNTGAAFSDRGFARLVDRAGHDEALAICVGARADIPWHHFANLMAAASMQVRAKLEKEFPHARRDVDAAVAEATARIAKLHGAALGVTDIEAALAEMHRNGRLDDEQLRCFAEDGLLEHVTLSLCLIANASREFVEAALKECSSETLIVLAKARGLSWATVRAIIQIPLGCKRQRTLAEQRQCLARYERLNSETAEQIIQFHRRRASH